MSFDGGLDVGERNGCCELDVGFDEVATAGEQEAQSDVRGGKGRVGVDGLTVAGFGGQGLLVLSGGGRGWDWTRGLREVRPRS